MRHAGAMRSAIAFLIALVTLFGAPVAMQAQVISTETYVEEWDDAAGQWVRVDEGAERLINGPAAHAARAAQAIATYGPFRVMDERTAQLVGATNAATPSQFAAMLRDYPAIATIDMVECPGTDDDRANMRLGRMIRAAGIATHVPAGGSVRSGAVELFLAGARRQIDDGAEFAVHAWLDDSGRQPHQFAPDSPENRTYLDFYTEMGMEMAQARAFYDMTNSVTNNAALWLDAQDMRRWTGSGHGDGTAIQQANADDGAVIAYLDLGSATP